MAEPAESYPESATLGADERTDGEMPDALREALVDHDEDLAAAVEATDELDDVLTTAILVAASADTEELAHLSDSASNLIDIADGLTTDEVAALTDDLGEDADDVADLLTIAAALGASLSPSEVERLSSMVEDNGSELVDALDVLLALHSEGTLTDLLDLAETLSTLEIDDDTVRGLNTVLGAVGEAQRESETGSQSGLLDDIRSADFREGVGYLRTLLRALGRRVRTR